MVLDLIRVEVLPALREPRPALGLQSQLGPQIPELIRMSTPPPMLGQKTTRTLPLAPRAFLRKVPSSRAEAGPSLERHITYGVFGGELEPKKTLAVARRKRILAV